MKWEMIAVMVVAGTFFGMMTLGGINKENIKVEMAKAGLEECPNLNTVVVRTIWVKSCKEYTETVKGLE